MKKREISRNGNSLSLVVIRGTTRCTTRCHSLSLVVITANFTKSDSAITHKTLQISQEIPPFRSSHQRTSMKKLFLKMWQYPQENTYVGASF